MGAPYGNDNAAKSHRKKAKYSPFVNPADMTGTRGGHKKNKKLKWHNPKRVTDFRNKRH